MNEETMFPTNLTRALADPAMTIILVTLDDKGGLVCQVRSQRPRDLVMAAQSLLSQATDLLDTEIITMEDDVLLAQAQRALDELPDPHADEDGE